MKSLSLTNLWNNSLILEDKELKPRDWCRASELGKTLVDRYLIMKGEKPSNPPNDRSRRKFFAGHVWEYIAGLILTQMGIIISKQEVTKTEDMPLVVYGHLDYLVGGRPNYNKARDEIKRVPMDEAMLERFLKVIDNFEQEYGTDEIETRVHEIKSVSHYAIEKIQNGGVIDGHDLQIDHYQRALKMDHGLITYISKDDALMAERIVSRSKELDDRLRKDITTLKGHLESNTRPEAAPLILFEEKFTKNFGVEYSQYLTLVYGFDTPEEYRNAVQSKIASWNRLLKRLKDINEGKTTPTGKPILLTDKNKIAIDEINKAGWDAQNLAVVAVVEEDEEITIE